MERATGGRKSTRTIALGNEPINSQPEKLLSLACTAPILCVVPSPPLVRLEQLKPMLPFKRLAVPAYLVCLALVLLPLVDVMTTLFPWQFAEARWRFGAVGLISNALLLPMAGLLVALAMATATENRAMRLTVGIVSAAAATVSVLALALFGLDAVQTSAVVRPEMRTSFIVASTTAAGKTLIATVTFTFLALAALKGRKSAATQSSAQRPALIPVDSRSTTSAGR